MCAIASWCIYASLVNSNAGLHRFVECLFGLVLAKLVGNCRKADVVIYLQNLIKILLQVKSASKLVRMMKLVQQKITKMTLKAIDYSEVMIIPRCK